MINFRKYQLNNGLRLIIQKDTSTPLAAVNVLYNVGAKDEDEHKTGFAHLFEHLMFGGSKNIPSYDTPLQRVGGDNNAWTNNDITNYYLTLPASNIETGLWLESDRMLELDFSEKSLDVQRKVVIEEYKQRYLNYPYGDLPLIVRPLVYKKHPYRWPTIGADIKHIEDANLSDVKNFFFSHYAPNNAIISIAGNVEYEKTYNLVKKWFDDIPFRNVKERNLPLEPKQSKAVRHTVVRDVPIDLINISFHMCERNNPDYYAADLLSDLLSNGTSARLHEKLVKQKKLFTEIHAFLSGDIEKGLFTFIGYVNNNVNINDAENAIWEEIEIVKSYPCCSYELQKIKNKVEASLIFSKTNFLNNAMNLAQFELLGNANDINTELDKYNKVSSDDIMQYAKEILVKENSTTLHYLSKQKQ